ncbi:MAG: hypothetical protein Fur0014_20340 [Rubrivivax sp.]
MAWIVTAAAQALSECAYSAWRRRPTRRGARRGEHGPPSTAPETAKTLRTAAGPDLALAAALPAAAQAADAFVHDLSVPQGLTRAEVRAEVRAELEAARLAGVLPQPGEAGDSDALLVARAEFERLSTQVRLAQRAEEPSPAMQEAVLAMAEAMGNDERLAREPLALLQDDSVIAGMAIERIDVEDGEP